MSAELDQDHFFPDEDDNDDGSEVPVICKVHQRGGQHHQTSRNSGAPVSSLSPQSYEDEDEQVDQLSPPPPPEHEENKVSAREMKREKTFFC